MVKRAVENCVISKPAEIGSRAMKTDERKRSEWLTVPDRLRQPEVKGQKRHSLYSYEVIKAWWVFMTKFEQRNVSPHWARSVILPGR